MNQSVEVIIRPSSSMPAHQDDHHSVQRLQFTRPETQSPNTTDAHQAVRSPSDGTQQAHRRKIRRVSPRSVSQGSQSSEEEAVDEEQMMDDDAFIAARNSSSRKMPLPAAHEIKYLRQEAAVLERQFRLLCAKWKTHLPDENVRLRACEAAKQKTVTMQVERINAELKQQLLQQQLYFSSLQSSLSESPLWQSNKNCQAIYRDIHYELRLKDNGDAERRAALQARFETAVREASRTVDRYTIDHIRSTSPAIPYSHTSTSGTEEFTFLSNVFICKIPNATLEQVFQAALEHHRQLPEQLNRHLAMDVSSKPILSLDETRHYSQLQYGSGDFAGVRSNVTFQAEMVSPELAVMVVDLVDEDELNPSNSANQLSKDGLSILTLTPVRDESTGQNCILLRRLLVHRYNLLPNSSRLHKEVNSLVSYVNGDLSMAIVCQALQANARKSDENR